MSLCLRVSAAAVVRMWKAGISDLKMFLCQLEGSDLTEQEQEAEHFEPVAGRPAITCFSGTLVN